MTSNRIPQLGDADYYLMKIKRFAKAIRSGKLVLDPIAAPDIKHLDAWADAYHRRERKRLIKTWDQHRSQCLTENKDKKGVEKEFQVVSMKRAHPFYKTFREAYVAVLTDPDVWKLSWNDEFGVRYRWIPHSPRDVNRPDSDWSDTSIAKLKQLSKAYAECKDPDAVFWIHQTMYDGPNSARLIDDNSLTEKQRDKMLWTDKILEVLTEFEFFAKFKDI